jgi:hypothetical protein
MNLIEVGDGQDLCVSSRDEGPLVLSLHGGTSEIRVGSEDGPPLMPFLDETDRMLNRRMFQLVPSGAPKVEYKDGYELTSTWTFFARFETSDEMAAIVRRRAARIELERMRDEPDQWFLKFFINGIGVLTELRGFVETTVPVAELLPSYARLRLARHEPSKRARARRGH